MKKGIAIISLLLICVATPSAYRAQCYIEKIEPVNYYEPLIRAIVEVECKGNYLAYNKKEQATGPFQIRPIRLKHYNHDNKSNYNLKDMYDYDTAKKVFMHFTKGRNYEKVAKSWNGRGKKNIEYWNKVKHKL